MAKPTRDELIATLAASYSVVTATKVDRGLDITCPSPLATCIRDRCTSAGLDVTEVYPVAGNPHRMHLRVFGFPRKVT